MAITPEEAKKLTDDELQLVDSIEKNVDSYIKKNFNDRAMDIPLEKDEIKERVKDEIVKRYKEAGWKQVYFNIQQKDKKLVLRISPFELPGYLDR